MDLISNKMLPDPFFRDNEKYLSQYENSSWEYVSSFMVPESFLSFPNTEIIFEGLDTHTIIYLNEKEILRTHDYFLEYRASIKHLLKNENNTLKIYFESALEYDEIKKKEFLPIKVPSDNPNRTPFSRKPRFHYGWDWGPRIVSAGITKKIMIRGFRDFKIESLNIETIEFKRHNHNEHPQNIIRQTESLNKKNSYKINDKQINENLNHNQTLSAELFDALMRVEVKLKLDEGQKLKEFYRSDVLEMYFSTVINNKTLMLYPNATIHDDQFIFTFEITGVELWWSRGLGKQSLYDFKLVISTKDVREEINKRTGIRKAKLINESDEIGESFKINLNGQDVFAKGANYIPPEYFESKITNEILERDVREMLEANYNAIRVWGGGYFLPKIFYSLLDSAGIMVFHDFMFACEMYPAVPEYLELYELEIKQNLERLKSHPSIVLWIGNNEVHEAWDNWGFQSDLTEENKNLVWDWYLSIFHKLIPSLISSQSYWPSSPLYGYGHPESLLFGDSHFWSVWAAQKPITEYLKSGRFMSEYGMQGFPDRNTIFSFTTENDRNIESDVMKRHEKHVKGFENLGIYLEELFGYVSNNFEDYSYLTQVLQSFAIRTAIESHRSSLNCMGTLYWQMNDIWPGITWSSIDYYGRHKALHYEVKNLYQDLAFIGRVFNGNSTLPNTNQSQNITKIELNEEKEIKLYLINDLNELVSGSVEIISRNAKGEIIHSELLKIKQEPVSRTIIWTKKFSQIFSKKQRSLFFEIKGEFSQKEGQKRNLLYNFMWGWPKEWELLKNPKIKIDLDNGIIRVETDVVVRYLYLYLERAYLSLDRNYFDLIPRRVYECKILNLNEIEKSELTKENIKWKNLNDLLK